ncbi:YbaB/EbfC family nucleoid-associated protein [Naumannella sp. ID2617S]|uniref:Nucleoid-associated protein CGZ93_00135 n=1 Tax=Enemella dayhoffiae TaxID=2016507 RepID=A0A255HBI4_9ACTN|nr:YbaB/EbfC family nucleoid-associated protein [Enemella dayhoffiae]NNG19661.1 YbaB/EbfC family nucleoid-associated protein [Naumannella sp. ID2617S]OYO24931.1 YbaB/EbfC family nucleoid-associated protein [Enemella dayhoffiae]
MLPDGMDMNALLAQAQQMQAQMQQAQEEMAEAEFEGSAGGDLVQATLTGTGEIKALVIKPEACDPEDTEALADLVIAAIRDASHKVQVMTEAKFGGMANGLGF